MQKLFLILALFGHSLFCFSAIPALEREVTLSFTNEKLNTALERIQEQTGLIFSYPSSILANAPLVSIHLKQKTVREALALILPRGISIKAKSNYIILKEKAIDKDAKKTELNGYVYDKATDKKIANVTLYDKTTLQTVTTDAYGYYSISLPKQDQCLTVNKENYRDTCVSVSYLKDSSLTNIRIDPVNQEERRQDSITWRDRFRSFSQSTNDLFKRFKGYVNTLNVKDTLARHFQFSVLPFGGTNGLLSGNVYNHYSINALGGYSRGTKGLELGGLFNMDRENMSGAQLAGTFNIVGDSVKGLELAGSLNITGKYMSGIQGAGAININLGGGEGIQAAGSCNINIGNYSGLSAAGVLTIHRKSFKGLLLAGVLNSVKDTLDGYSLAGAINLGGVAKRSLQVAGVFNQASVGDRNVQMAGLLNRTDEGTSAFQAGVFNRTQKLTGMQLGVFNFCDSATGVPVGVLSFVKKGVHQLELSANELFCANISFRTGAHSFYNILEAGIQSKSKGPLWNVGYGVGTSVKIKNKLGADFTVTMHHVSSGSFYFATSELYKLYAGLEYRFRRRFSLAAGPTFNLYWTDALQPEYEGTYSKVAHYSTFSNTTRNGFSLTGWVGARIALRFF